MAKKLDGKVISADIRKEVAADLAQLRKKHPTFQPGLTIVQVNHRSNSVKLIMRYGKGLGTRVVASNCAT